MTSSQSSPSQQSLAQIAWALLGVSLIARAASVLSQLLVSNVYGTSEAADLFYFASTLVSSWQAIIVTVFSTLAITLLAEAEATGGSRAASEAADNLVTYSLLALVGMGIGLVVAPTVIVRWFAAFPAETVDRAAYALRLVTVASTVTAVTQILSAVHNARRRFVMPSVLAVLQTFVFMAIVLAGHRLASGVTVLSVATGASALVTVIALVGSFDRERRLAWRLRVSPPYLRIGSRQAWPLVVSQALASAWMLTGRGVVSGLATGSLAALTYAERLRGLFLEFLVTPLAPMALQRYSEGLSQGKGADAWDSLQRAVAGVWFAMVPAIVMVWLVGDWFIVIAFQRGAFTAWSTAITYGALKFYALGLWAEAAHFFVSRYFIASGQVLVGTLLGIPATAVYIAGAAYLTPRLGVQGVAISYVAMVITSHLLSVAWLWWRNDLRPARWFGRVVLKILASTVCSTTAMVGLRMIVVPTEPAGIIRHLIVFGAVSGVGGVVYLATGHFMGIDRDIPWLRTSLLSVINRWNPRAGVAPASTGLAAAETEAL